MSVRDAQWSSMEGAGTSVKKPVTARGTPRRGELSPASTRLPWGRSVKRGSDWAAQRDRQGDLWRLSQWVTFAPVPRQRAESPARGGWACEHRATDGWVWLQGAGLWAGAGAAGEVGRGWEVCRAELGSLDFVRTSWGAGRFQYVSDTVRLVV